MSVWEEWTFLGLFGVVLTCTVIGVVGRVIGIVAAAGFVAAWFVLPVVYRYAVGHALALAATPDPYSVVELFFLELGLVAVLFGPVTGTEYLNRQATAASLLYVGTVLFIVVVVGLNVLDEVWMTAALVVVLVVTLTYSYRRLGLKRLGLLARSETEGSTE